MTQLKTSFETQGSTDLQNEEDDFLEATSKQYDVRNKTNLPMVHSNSENLLETTIIIHKTFINRGAYIDPYLCITGSWKSMASDVCPPKFPRVAVTIKHL